MKIRTTLPEPGNKYYLVKAAGGYNPCVLGNSKHRYCDGSVLVNCVGWSTARFAEVIGEPRCQFLGNTNAENFYALAKKQGLEVGQEPRAGAVMVWSKGSTASGSDGAGHVANVEIVHSKTEVTTSESGWFYTNKYMDNVRRSKGTGNWGLGTGYKFLGFIYNPAVRKPIEVDGYWGKDTTRGAQAWLGTNEDGVVSGQAYACKKNLPNCATTSWRFSRIFKGGSDMVRALQKRLGLPVDGQMGPQTVRALQIFLRTEGFYSGTIDGVMGAGSVKAFQRYLNKYFEEL